MSPEWSCQYTQHGQHTKYSHLIAKYTKYSLLSQHTKYSIPGVGGATEGAGASGEPAPGDNPPRKRPDQPAYLGGAGADGVPGNTGLWLVNIVNTLLSLVSSGSWRDWPGGSTAGTSWSRSPTLWPTVPPSPGEFRTLDRGLTFGFTFRQKTQSDRKLSGNVSELSRTFLRYPLLQVSYSTKSLWSDTTDLYQDYHKLKLTVHSLSAMRTSPWPGRSISTLTPPTDRGWCCSTRRRGSTGGTWRSTTGSSRWARYFKTTRRNILSSKLCPTN